MDQRHADVRALPGHRVHGPVLAHRPEPAQHDWRAVAARRQTADETVRSQAFRQLWLPSRLGAPPGCSGREAPADLELRRGRVALDHGGDPERPDYPGRDPWSGVAQHLRWRPRHYLLPALVRRPVSDPPRATRVAVLLQEGAVSGHAPERSDQEPCPGAERPDGYVWRVDQREHPGDGQVARRPLLRVRRLEKESVEHRYLLAPMRRGRYGRPPRRGRQRPNIGWEVA
jgi:hypothetical protein